MSRDTRGMKWASTKTGMLHNEVIASVPWREKSTPKTVDLFARVSTGRASCAPTKCTHLLRQNAGRNSRSRVSSQHGRTTPTSSNTSPRTGRPNIDFWLESGSIVACPKRTKGSPNDQKRPRYPVQCCRHGQLAHVG